MNRLSKQCLYYLNQMILPEYMDKLPKVEAFKRIDHYEYHISQVVTDLAKKDIIPNEYLKYILVPINDISIGLSDAEIPMPVCLLLDYIDLTFYKPINDIGYMELDYKTVSDLNRYQVRMRVEPIIPKWKLVYLYNCYPSTSALAGTIKSVLN